MEYTGYFAAGTIDGDVDALVIFLHDESGKKIIGTLLPKDISYDSLMTKKTEVMLGERTTCTFFAEVRQVKQQVHETMCQLKLENCNIVLCFDDQRFIQ